MAPAPWLVVERGHAPLILSMPHVGVDLADLAPRFVSRWLARKDTDWWVDRLYEFAAELGATIVRTAISRTVIDVNRDPSGASLYPGQATTELCPTTTFDGEPLYRDGRGAGRRGDRARAAPPISTPITRRWRLSSTRLRGRTAESCSTTAIRSARAFPACSRASCPSSTSATNGGASGRPRAQPRGGRSPAARRLLPVVDGRFKGGWITRALRQSAAGVHAMQMELACRGYLREPIGPVDETNWPTPYDPALRRSDAAHAERMSRQPALDWLREIDL